MTTVPSEEWENLVEARKDLIEARKDLIESTEKLISLYIDKMVDFVRRQEHERATLRRLFVEYVEREVSKGVRVSDAEQRRFQSLQHKEIIENEQLYRGIATMYATAAQALISYQDHLAKPEQHI